MSGSEKNTPLVSKSSAVHDSNGRKHLLSAPTYSTPTPAKYPPSLMSLRPPSLMSLHPEHTLSKSAQLLPPPTSRSQIEVSTRMETPAENSVRSKRTKLSTTSKSAQLLPPPTSRSQVEVSTRMETPAENSVRSKRTKLSTTTTTPQSYHVDTPIISKGPTLYNRAPNAATIDSEASKVLPAAFKDPSAGVNNSPSRKQKNKSDPKPAPRFDRKAELLEELQKLRKQLVKQTENMTIMKSHQGSPNVKSGDDTSPASVAEQGKDDDPSTIPGLSLVNQREPVWFTSLSNSDLDKNQTLHRDKSSTNVSIPSYRTSAQSMPITSSSASHGSSSRSSYQTAAQSMYSETRYDEPPKGKVPRLHAHEEREWGHDITPLRASDADTSAYESGMRAGVERKDVSNPDMYRVSYPTPNTAGVALPPPITVRRRNMTSASAYTANSTPLTGAASLHKPPAAAHEAVSILKLPISPREIAYAQLVEEASWLPERRPARASPLRYKYADYADDLPPSQRPPGYEDELRHTVSRPGKRAYPEERYSDYDEGYGESSGYDQGYDHPHGYDRNFDKPYFRTRPPLRAAGPPLRAAGPPLRAAGPPLRGTEPSLRGARPPMRGINTPLRAAGPPMRGTGPRQRGAGAALGTAWPSFRAPRPSLTGAGNPRSLLDLTLEPPPWAKNDEIIASWNVPKESTKDGTKSKKTWAKEEAKKAPISEDLLPYVGLEECELCKVQFNHPNHAKSHLVGKTHTKKLKIYGMPVPELCVDKTKPNWKQWLDKLNGVETETTEDKTEDAEEEEPWPEWIIEQLHDDFCGICNVPLSSISTADSHYEGKKHYKKVNAVYNKGEKPKDANAEAATRFHCDICHIYCSSHDMMQKHFAGVKHVQAQHWHRASNDKPNVTDVRETEVDVDLLTKDEIVKRNSEADATDFLATAAKMNGL